ncbi:MAG: hypothetical protein ACHP93_04145 [Solirubrobacterales bacterium]
MGICEVCGNEYDKTMDIIVGNGTHTFDSFECAIHALAPSCGHCGCRIVGHGVESNEVVYCGAYCAHQAGVAGVSDRA